LRPLPNSQLDQAAARLRADDPAPDTFQLHVAVDLQAAVARAPEPGQLAVVCGRRWVVADIIRSELPADVTTDLTPLRQHLVSLISV